MENSSTISLARPLSPAESRIVWRIADNKDSFGHFIFREKANRLYLGLALAGVIVQFIVFKLLYPFPDFFSDSYSYIYAAYAHLDVSIWPIGYSKFLAAFHNLTHSATALVGFQYFFLELSALYFFFTWSYFFRPGGNSRVVLFCFLFLNPLFLYISNYVNSDPLFAALSLWWFTELIWIINRPRLYQVFTQGVLLFLCFTVRNNAYYYPLVAIVAFTLSRQSGWLKLAGCLFGPALILPFVLHTRAVAKRMTGTAQFSLFTGWQLASNALYMYDKIAVDSTIFNTASSKDLNRIAASFFEKIPASENKSYREFLGSYVGNFFVRQPESPLKRYVEVYCKSPLDYTQVDTWGKASVVFSAFGIKLVRDHPVAYFRYFILLNAGNYFLPPLEKLAIYNLGSDHVGRIGKEWFDLKSTFVKSASAKMQGFILMPYPVIFFLSNIILAGAVIIFVAKRSLRTHNQTFRNILLLASGLLLFNAIFCISTTIIVFRYETVPLIIAFSLALLVIERLDGNIRKNSVIPIK